MIEPHHLTVAQAQEQTQRRQRIIEHILWIKTMDVREARASLMRQHAWQPWLNLLNGVRKALEQQKK